MRFLPDGPDIPDELLWARDKGEVVFFCGAGVSRHKAGLPDFKGLTKRVLSELRVLETDEVSRLLTAMEDISEQFRISGIFSADQIFSKLAEDFDQEHIEQLVSNALETDAGTDTSAHSTLAKLSRTPAGALQLVTTNFDLLFEHACPNDRSVYSPDLPNPKRPGALDGIIHLHGKIGASELTLTKAQFGRAYLAEGYAAQFVKELSEQFVLVFVGYSADDPPIQYLLESLDDSNSHRRSAFAFHEGSNDEGRKQWAAKRVQPICFPTTRFDLLWDTLLAWSDRSQDLKNWQAKVIELAQKKPEELAAFERGQVAHLVSSVQGARAFDDASPQPNAEWLAVFDPDIRFASPAPVPSYDWTSGERIDPFDKYGLDSDQPPSSEISDNSYQRRDVPADAWCAFHPANADEQPTYRDRENVLSGLSADSPMNLPPRLRILGFWLAKQSHNPACYWWAHKQPIVHSDIRNAIQREVNRHDWKGSDNLRTLWHLLFECWASFELNSDLLGYDWRHSKETLGWTPSTIKMLERVTRPRLLNKARLWNTVQPPRDDNELIPVWYFEVAEISARVIGELDPSEIPHDVLMQVARLQSQNVAQTLALEKLIDSLKFERIEAITPPETSQDRSFHSASAIQAALHALSGIFMKLRNIDVGAARHLYLSWPHEDETAFIMLRLWAAQFPDIVPGSEFRTLIRQLPNTVFWSSMHEWDLLHTLKARWTDLGSEEQKELENRLLENRLWNHSDTAKGELDPTGVDRLLWLQSRGCTLAIQLDEAIDVRSPRFPTGWKGTNADKRLAPLSSQSGWVGTKTDPEALLNIPLGDIIAKADAVTGRIEDFVEYDPFKGLVESHPVRALSALRHAARSRLFPQRAWHAMLVHAGNSSLSDRGKLLLAHTVSDFPTPELQRHLGPIASLLQSLSPLLTNSHQELFDNLFDRVAGVLEKAPDVDDSSTGSRKSRRDIATDALNAPPGDLAEALLRVFDPESYADDLRALIQWQNQAKRLLNLPEELAGLAMCIFARDVAYFHHHAPYWTQRNLVSASNSASTLIRAAFFCGLAHANQVSPSVFSEIKADLINFIAEPPADFELPWESLANLLFSGWLVEQDERSEPLVSNTEFHSTILGANDEFRSYLLHVVNVVLVRRDEHDNALDKLKSFLTDVWPIHQKIRTPETSSHLVRLAFDRSDWIEPITALILPFLSPMRKSTYFWIRSDEDGPSIATSHPHQLLAVLEKILPPEPHEWPYHMAEILTQLEIHDDIAASQQYMTIRKKWDERE